MAVAFSYIPPGSIGNYDDLVDKVALWMDRDDLVERVPDFVALLEARLNRILRVPEMETAAMLSATAERTALPLDFLQMRSLHVEGVPDRPLRAMAPGGVSETFSGRAGLPVAYSIAGRNLTLAPPPQEPVTLAIAYWQRIPSLSSITPTNWLLEQHPDIYLYGSLIQAEAYLSNDERVALWKAAHDEAVGELQQAGQRARWGAGPLVPNTVHQTRGARC
jgi:hypothetical protein